MDNVSLIKYARERARIASKVSSKINRIAKRLLGDWRKKILTNADMGLSSVILFSLESVKGVTERDLDQAIAKDGSGSAKLTENVIKRMNTIVYPAKVELIERKRDYRLAVSNEHYEIITTKKFVVVLSFDGE